MWLIVTWLFFCSEDLTFIVSDLNNYMWFDRKKHILLRTVWNCEVTANYSEHDYKYITVINK